MGATNRTADTLEGDFLRTFCRKNNTFVFPDLFSSLIDPSSSRDSKIMKRESGRRKRSLRKQKIKKASEVRREGAERRHVFREQRSNEVKKCKADGLRPLRRPVGIPFCAAAAALSSGAAAAAAQLRLEGKDLARQNKIRALCCLLAFVYPFLRARRMKRLFRKEVNEPARRSLFLPFTCRSG